MILPFTKMQGIGNDFVVVDARTGLEADWPEAAVAWCRRHFGIGADGLLVISNAPDADARMEMFNPDGTRDFCGNGLRCVARFVADGMPGAGRRQLRIATDAGVRQCEVAYDGSGVTVTVDMGLPAFDPPGIPMAVDLPEVVDYPLPLTEAPSLPSPAPRGRVRAGAALTISALSTGTTHAVTFVDALPDDAEFLTVSPEVELHPLFPERTSLMWVRRVSESRLSMRIWERGASETLGCGTGACAAAVAARRKGLIGRSATVASAGGELTVTWDPGEHILMAGPAERVFEGRVEL